MKKQRTPIQGFLLLLHFVMGCAASQPKPQPVEDLQSYSHEAYSLLTCVRLTNYKCVEYAFTTTIDPARDIHIAVRGIWKEATLELKDANDSSVSILFLRIRANPPLDTTFLPVRIYGLGEVQVLATQFRYGLSEPLLAMIKITYGAHPVTFVVRNGAQTKMIPAVLIFADHRPSVTRK